MIPVGCKSIDQLLGGGLPKGVMTQVYGSPGSGKTNLCLQVVKANPGKKILFIDTESSFHPTRVEQIMAGLDKSALDKVKVYAVMDFAEQSTVLSDLPEADILIIDSISSLYRLQRSDDGLETSRILGNQVASILAFARKLDIPILVTNQVYTDINNGNYAPVGGDVLRYASKVIIELKREDGPLRRAVLRKHFAKQDGSNVFFKIVESGII